MALLLTVESRREKITKSRDGDIIAGTREDIQLDFFFRIWQNKCNGNRVFRRFRV
jgi:hypothetical protein